MKKTSKSNALRAEYDFSTMPGGIRGKYARAYREGTNIVVLADDVASAFPTDDSVNQALRTILEAARSLPRRKKARKVSTHRLPQKRTR